MTYALIAIISLLGGVVHCITGFGYGILMMSVLVMVMPFKSAVVVMLISSIVLNLRICIEFYKHINWKFVLFPLLASIITRCFSMGILMKGNEHYLRMGFGVLLLVLAIFFMTTNNIKIKPTALNGVSIGLLSGFMDGVFGLCGPPLAMYCFAATKDAYEYNATLNLILGAMAVHGIFLHYMASNINGNILLMSMISIVALIIGSAFGLRVFSSLNSNKLKKLIFGYMVVIGVLFIFNI